MEPSIINKEDIKGKVRFPAQDVLNSAEERKNRQRLLEHAMRLGNGYKGKIRIVFVTDEGERIVETTVWAATESNVQLKGDVSIPIHAIRAVIV